MLPLLLSVFCRFEKAHFMCMKNRPPHKTPVSGYYYERPISGQELMAYSVSPNRWNMADKQPNYAVQTWAETQNVINCAAADFFSALASETSQSFSSPKTIVMFISIMIINHFYQHWRHVKWTKAINVWYELLSNRNCWHGLEQFSSDSNLQILSIFVNQNGHESQFLYMYSRFIRRTNRMNIERAKKKIRMKKLKRTERKVSS